MAPTRRGEETSRRARVSVALCEAGARRDTSIGQPDRLVDAAPCCRHIVLLRGGRFDGQDVFVTGDEWACGIYATQGLRYESNAPPLDPAVLRVFDCYIWKPAR